MCGIVGYTGPHEASPILVAGLRRLEYRGYDSAGLADARRATGSTSGSGPAGSGRWRSCSSSEPAAGPLRDQPHALGHPRAGHRPQRPPAPRRPGRRPGRRRPQRRDREPRRAPPRARGRGLRLPEPDRHRGHRPPDRPRARATATTCSRPSSGPCRGSRGPTAWPSSARGHPGQVIGARLGSPLVVGVGDGEHFLASDAVAIAPHTAQRGLPPGRRGRPAHARRLRDPPPRARARSRRGSTGSTGSPTRSSWAATRTTCSRRSTSSPRRCATPAAAGSAAPRRPPTSAG